MPTENTAISPCIFSAVKSKFRLLSLTVTKTSLGGSCLDVHRVLTTQFTVHKKEVINDNSG